MKGENLELELLDVIALYNYFGLVGRCCYIFRTLGEIILQITLKGLLHVLQHQLKCFDYSVWLIRTPTSFIVV